MSDWTIDDMPDLSGKVMIVTGANSGLGYASAKILSQKGATVILACRNRARGRQALAAIRAEAPQAQAGLLELDLASLASVKACADTFKERFDRLDVLMNNAGLSLLPRTETEDGFEMHLGVNHLGHFALTGLLLERLLATPKSRVVTVTSRMHATAIMNWDDLMSEQSYDKWAAYRRSKLANLLFAFELQRRFEATGADSGSLAAHPGFAATDWGSDLKGLQAALLRLASRLFGQSAEDGARPQLYAAVDPRAAAGLYYGPRGGMRGGPVAMRASEAAYDQGAAERLWRISERLTGVAYERLEIPPGQA